MNVEVAASDELPRVAASLIARLLAEAVTQRGSATVALSGGSTPARMLAELARAQVPWGSVHLLQVDERLAPDGDPSRNLTLLDRELVRRLPTPPAGIHPMPVADALAPGAEPQAAAASYAALLARLAGEPPRLDVVQLGLGADGHTASLVPADPVLDVTADEVAITGRYQGHRRMTLTYPALARAHHLVWLVEGSSKADAVRRLRAVDATIPAGRVPQHRAVLLADHAAAGHRA